MNVTVSSKKALPWIVGAFLGGMTLSSWAQGEKKAEPAPPAEEKAPPAEEPAPPAEEKAEAKAAEPAQEKAAEPAQEAAPPLSGEEQIEQADDMIAKMRQVLARIEELARVAREKKDIVRLNCVNDKLIQVKGRLNLAEQVAESLKAAVERGDEAGRTSEFGDFTILYQQVIVLGQEAENCAGEELAYVEETEVKVEVGDITEEDPTQPTEPTEQIVERTSSSSPFN